MADEMSNSDLLKEEVPSFANVRMPLNKNGSPGNEEIPFVIGIVDDVVGNDPGVDPGSLDNRRFDRVSKFTLDQKMKELQPGLRYEVDSKLKKGEKLFVRLRLDGMGKFSPREVANQIPDLARLIKLREDLIALKNRLGPVPEVKEKIKALINEMVKLSSRA